MRDLWCRGGCRMRRDHLALFPETRRHHRRARRHDSRVSPSLRWPLSRSRYPDDKNVSNLRPARGISRGMAEEITVPWSARSLCHCFSGRNNRVLTKRHQLPLPTTSALPSLTRKLSPFKLCHRSEALLTDPGVRAMMPRSRLSSRRSPERRRWSTKAELRLPVAFHACCSWEPPLKVVRRL